MSDDAIRLVTVGRMLRGRGRLLTALVVLGALVGLGASLVFPPRYSTSASVLLPGAWEERVLLTQAEIATSTVVTDRTAAALKWDGVDGEELRKRVRAEVTDGNIIKISGTAESPAKAQRLSDELARQFVAFSARIGEETADPRAAAGPEQLRQTVLTTSRRITELADAADPGRTVESVQTRTELAKLRTALQEAVEKLNQAQSGTAGSRLVVMGPAAKPSGEAPPTRVQLIAAGAVLFLLVAVVGHLGAARVNRRLRSEREIAAALRSGLLGGVDVPAAKGVRRPEADGSRHPVRRLLGLDTPWNAPAPPVAGDEASLGIRYRRVCGRIRDLMPGARRLLLVVPDDDGVALRAAERLVEEAGGDPRLRVAEVSAEAPLVPDREEESGVLVVLSAGTRTAAELAGFAEACADAGHDVVGIVLADAVRTRPARSAGPPREAAAPALALGDGARGGAR
ncbi:polysaccharide biosynthesis protein [Streptomyces thermocarboxydus]|uniref:Polysaccharide biosynthesis protein n=2 Tax=Streptomyces thermocarboxydus TaxID=59299 RepID=A0ABU3J047_9ACTN|nr:polysaccharide biosynthesis protein [Streptomyces thermocarboxydus]